ncbi:aldo/keto reductase [Sphingomonas sp. S1-29]|uniref:aldo/keto reductase n=1 Tax=Sphingomonas sp. S1-29 TaxID=2991074 RepID=UPI00223EEC2A|nr:aldo/keto reductase [Sphingomonas sp. S1-29]UZK68418.1 aldo/keto reductase [Sphingomonas sp. S1-29]
MLELNDGRAIPQLGFGTYKVPQAIAAQVVRSAIDTGYKLVDTAALYENERGVGEALASIDDVFVTTKLWANMHEDAEGALDQSLALLGRDSVDLYLIHWPAPGQGKFVEAWKGLVRLRDAGKAKSIGVSNFLPEHIEAIFAATGVMPAVNQIELHPDFQQREARAFHEQHGIVTQSWSPLGQGTTINSPVIAKIAQKHGRSPAQIILRWHIQHGLAVIPKASDEAHMRDNFGATEGMLDADDMAAIDSMDRADGRLGPDPLAQG